LLPYLREERESKQKTSEEREFFLLIVFYPVGIYSIYYNVYHTVLPISDWGI
jgi:hypothetical protein